MIRLVWRTDVHLSDKTPSSRKDDWTKTVLRKLRQVGLVADKVGADAVLDGGDFFHVKSPTRNSHELAQKAATVHQGYTCPVYANVGNHDCKYANLEFLDEGPLGVLFASGVFQRCYDEHEAVFERDGMKVRVVGIPFHGPNYEMERFTSITKGDEDYLVVMAHVLASTKGGSMFEGEDIIKYKDIAHLDPDLWLFGHWHKDQGIEEINGKQFVNLGSLTRGALTQDEMDRRPACAVLTFTENGIGIQVVRLKVEDAETVFDVTAKVRSESRASTMNAFVDALKESLVLKDGQSVEEAIANVEGIPHVIRERALSFVEKAG